MVGLAGVLSIQPGSLLAEVIGESAPLQGLGSLGEPVTQACASGLHSNRLGQRLRLYFDGVSDGG